MPTTSGTTGDTGRKVFFVSDEAMLLHRCEWDENNLEVPARLEAILNRIQSCGLFDELEVLPSRVADLCDIQLVHSESYISKIASSKQMDLEEMEEACSWSEDVYMNEHTFNAALLSAGCALEAMEAVLKAGTTRPSAAFAAIRPPGHHASKETACGFCFFNNVAICAKKALQFGASRVLIVDWDVHAGQGTQYSIEDDPNILLVSIHRFEDGNFWPQLPESAVVNPCKHLLFSMNRTEDTNTVNIPLNSTGFGDIDYMAIMAYVVSPIIRDFRPSLVLVSCGFDAALGDPEGEMNVTPGGFYWMTHIVLEEAAKIHAPVCALLEGGYFLDAVAAGTEFCLNFFGHEYQGTREIEFPYETRGVYPARDESVVIRFCEKLNDVMKSYSYEKVEPKLVINFVTKETERSSDANVCNVQLLQGTRSSDVLEFFGHYVCGHVCDYCSSWSSLRTCSAFCQKETLEFDDNAEERATVESICSGVLDLFARGLCLQLKKLVLYDEPL